MGMGQNPGTPVVHIKIAGKWMFIPLKMVLIGIDPYPYLWPPKFGLVNGDGLPLGLPAVYHILMLVVLILNSFDSLDIWALGLLIPLVLCDFPS